MREGFTVIATTILSWATTNMELLFFALNGDYCLKTFELLEV